MYTRRYCPYLEGNTQVLHVYLFLFCFHRVSELFVDNPGNTDEKIPVQINITLPRLACECNESTSILTKQNLTITIFIQMLELIFKMILGDMTLALLKTL
jgi:hypothetical protein